MNGKNNFIIIFMKPPCICGKWIYTGKIIKINEFGQDPDICNTSSNSSSSY